MDWHLLSTVDLSRILPVDLSRILPVGGSLLGLHSLLGLSVIRKLIQVAISFLSRMGNFSISLNTCSFQNPS